MACVISGIKGQGASSLDRPSLTSLPVARNRWELIRQKAVGGAGHQISSQREAPEPYPTVLVAGNNQETRRPLVHSLRQECLVLEADTVSRVLDVVKIHSRPIHVLLLDVSMGDPALAALVQRYRSGMQVLFVTGSSGEAAQDALPRDGALAKARELLKLKNGRRQVRPDCSAS